VLTVSDFIHLPYTRDLTEGGVAYALHCLPYLYHRMGSSPYEHLRRVVAGAMVELAFRRYLSEEGIPFEVRSAAPFTDPDRYDVTLAGHRCDLKSFLISHPDQIAQIQYEPQVLLKAPALVPSDQHAGIGHSGLDLYLFAFLPALLTTSQSDLQKTFRVKQPHYLIHVMPEKWKRPSRWSPLGMLVLKSEAEENVTIEIGGQAKGRERRSYVVEVPSLRRVRIETDLFSLAYIHVKSKPSARLGIYSPILRETHLVGGSDWGNIWVYGIEVLLAGYMAREEFSRRASAIQAGTRVFQYDQTHVKNLAVPVSELRPLSELFKHVREWSAQQQSETS
jgi:hypothetical protein